MKDTVYRATPLQRNQFRVLHVQPAPSVAYPLVARLSVESFDRDGRPSVAYEALSYTWGDASEKAVVFVDEHEVTVTRSLELALRSLRGRERAVVIWADGICINQQDLVEKSIQVPYMGQLYRKANIVRIWLGEAGAATEAAMGLVNRCAAARTEEELWQNVVADRRGGVEGVTEMLGRRYWTRVWVFQEVRVASRATVHCGAFSAPWETFVKIDEVLDRLHARHAAEEKIPEVYELYRAFGRIVQFTHNLGQSLGGAAVAVNMTSRFQAGDPRDKLFALIGTCDIGSYLTVDYTMSVRDVYVAFARRLMDKTGRLDLLLGAGWHNPPRSKGELPSWTPDFELRDGGLLAADAYIGMMNFFNATKGTKFRLSTRLGAGAVDGLLETEGFLLGSVEESFPLDHGDEGRRKGLAAFDIGRMAGRNPSGKAQMEALCEMMVFEYQNVASKKDDKAQLLMGCIRDLDVSRRGALPRRRDGLLDLATLLGPDSKVLSSVVDKYNYLAGTRPEVLEEYRQKFAEAYEMLHGAPSAAFTTGTGYIGRSNRPIRNNDVVAMLCGSTIPVVLRRCDSGYAVVSGCYVSGVMFGELMDARNPRYKIQKFLLV
ncbi:Heterokaryon incompatibility protein 6, OR allele [Colletotrichum spinosum]|uniref:Heterokaryon incompatibility protein 6, OR allele n=1 Tax=Colletotrichum spinosum TaxID=1347390 RepID=A0A4R8PWY7_9PEZI|nr:Heterokaryon incompatibility protein 6, OR allele [Colletotrichum spinosum]